MSGKRFGKAVIAVNGKEWATERGATLNLGGASRAGIADHPGHFTEERKPSELECAIHLGADDDPAELAAIDNGTVTFTADTGQAWVIRGAYCMETLSISEGSPGKVAVKFGGHPAEAV